MTETAAIPPGVIKFDVLDTLRIRLQKGRNIISAFTGDPGSGKSFGAISVGERLRSDLDFSIDNIVFGFREFISRFSECDNGDLLSYEEAGAEFGARSAMSWDNKEFSKILQVFRFKQVPCIFNLPHLMMLDKNGRRLLNTWQKSRYVNKKLEMGIANYFVIKADDWGDEIRRYYIRVRDERIGIQVKLDPIGLPKPGDKIVSEYLKKKAEYFDEVIEEIKARQGTLSENYTTKPIPIEIPNIGNTDSDTFNEICKEWTTWKNREDENKEVSLDKAEKIQKDWKRGQPSPLEFKPPGPVT